MLLSTFASYVNYYGIWRILRAKDEYDAGQDLKSHASDVPQALQTLLASRSGCLPAASTALLCVALLLAVATILPPTTPVVGALGTWNEHSSLAGGAPPARPSVAASPTATPSVAASPTVPPRPTAVPTATSTPVVIRFAVSPTTASWRGCLTGTPPPSQVLTLDNSQSTVAVSWQASAVETVDTGKLWAVITPASGTVPAHSKRAITVSPDPSSPIDVCAASSASGTPWHVKIVAADAGTSTFTYTVY
jgi:hypothetical protein